MWLGLEGVLDRMSQLGGGEGEERGRRGGGEGEERGRRGGAEGEQRGRNWHNSSTDRTMHEQIDG